MVNWCFFQTRMNICFGFGFLIVLVVLEVLLDFGIWTWGEREGGKIESWPDPCDEIMEILREGEAKERTWRHETGCP